MFTRNSSWGRILAFMAVGALFASRQCATPARTSRSPAITVPPLTALILPAPKGASDKRRRRISPSRRWACPAPTVISSPASRKVVLDQTVTVTA